MLPVSFVPFLYCSVPHKLLPSSSWHPKNSVQVQLPPWHNQASGHNPALYTYLLPFLTDTHKKHDCSDRSKLLSEIPKARQPRFQYRSLTKMFFYAIFYYLIQFVVLPHHRKIPSPFLFCPVSAPPRSEEAVRSAGYRQGHLQSRKLYFPALHPPLHHTPVQEAAPYRIFHRKSDLPSWVRRNVGISYRHHSVCKATLSTQLCISIAIVIGPTPPGTGVI